MSSTIQFLFVIIAIALTICESKPKDKHAPHGTAAHSPGTQQPRTTTQQPSERNLSRDEIDTKIDTDSDEKSDDDDEKNNDSRNEETKRHDGKPMILTEKQKKELDEAGKRNAAWHKEQIAKKDGKNKTSSEELEKVIKQKAALEALQSKGTNPPTAQNPPHHPKTPHNTKAK